MDFDFTDDQEHLRDAVRKWVERSYQSERRRAAARAGGYDPSTYAELAALGLTGLYVPEAYGGMGMGPVEGLVVMEELGRGIVLEPVGQALVAAGLLSRYAAEPLQSAWLTEIASGAALVVLAYQEHGARYRLNQVEAHASREGDNWMVSGSKSIVPAGDHAHAFIVPAKTEGSIALFLVERSANGIATSGYSSLDGSRSAEVALRNTPASLITLDGLPALEHAVDIGIAATCAEGVGAMDKIMALTGEYLQTRRQFGVALASFQALRHRMADMKMQLELARSMSYYAALKLHAPAADRRRALARAKYQLGVAMRFVGQNAVQLHGGVGVTDEYVGSHYFKKLTQLELTFGDTAHHLGEVSARMQESASVSS